MNFEHLGFIGFNQIMRTMTWIIFARMSNPSYLSLIRRFYANLSKPHKHCAKVTCTLKGDDIELSPSTMCEILRVNDEGNELHDSNIWPIVPNFDVEQALKRLCKPDS